MGEHPSSETLLQSNTQSKWVSGSSLSWWHYAHSCGPLKQSHPKLMPELARIWLLPIPVRESDCIVAEDIISYFESERQFTRTKYIRGRKYKFFSYKCKLCHKRKCLKYGKLNKRKRNFSRYALKYTKRCRVVRERPRAKYACNLVQSGKYKFKYGNF